MPPSHSPIIGEEISLRISIALATYNGSAFLREQLASIASQTRLPDEVVVRDDRSEDDTLAIVEAFARTAPFPIHFERNEDRLNFRANFMKAAAACSGDLIAFCDQDDIWRHDKLACVAAEFDDDDVLLVCHNARIYSAEHGVSGSLYDKSVPSKVYAPLSRTLFNMPPGFTQTFRRSLIPLFSLRELTFDMWSPGDSLAHDQWVHTLASALGKVSYINEDLVDYRQHANNLFGMKISNPSRLDRIVHRLTWFSHYGHIALACERIGEALANAADYPLDAPPRPSPACGPGDALPMRADIGRGDHFTSLTKASSATSSTAFAWVGCATRTRTLRPMTLHCGRPRPTGNPACRNAKGVPGLPAPR
jgi:glycosyltransferase involved in cell wall biosynthesis